MRAALRAGIAALVVAALPLVLRDFQVTLLTEATILGLLVMSLDLVMGDGRVRLITSNIDEDVFKKLATRAGREPVADF